MDIKICESDLIEKEIVVFF